MLCLTVSKQYILCQTQPVIIDLFLSVQEKSAETKIFLFFSPSIFYSTNRIGDVISSGKLLRISEKYLGTCESNVLKENIYHVKLIKSCTCTSNKTVLVDSASRQY